MKNRKKPEIISASQLRKGLRAYLRKASAGETMVVTSYGKADAKLVPPDSEGDK